MFREYLLAHLPVARLAAGFRDGHGRPSKDLSVALGALILQQLHDLTDQQTTETVALNLAWHYALDIRHEPDAYLCERTLRNYEALLELEPGVASEPMCRLKRQKLEVVVPLAQGEPYRPVEDTGRDPDEEDDSDDEETPASSRGKKTKVEWIEEIPPGRFYLRVGLGRKSSGSYYTPHSFVRFLVQETLGPQVAERSPEDDPQPLEILRLKVLDPAMGSGHFLVEACRFLGKKLYEACRLCDEKALAAERRAEKVKKSEAEALHEEARQWRQRVIDLPDPDDELLKYLAYGTRERHQGEGRKSISESVEQRSKSTGCEITASRVDPYYPTERKLAVQSGDLSTPYCSTP